jgi:hypothetical protein
MAEIDAFRTKDFRVFHSAPFFRLNLFYEIKWQKKHIKKLHKYLRKPHKYFKDHYDRALEERHHDHFHEHVVESIPFHQKIMDDHMKHAKVINSIMSKFTYNRIARISMEHGGIPDYLVYDKKKKDFFFVIAHLTTAKKKWKHLVEGKYRICEVLAL